MSKINNRRFIRIAVTILFALGIIAAFWRFSVGNQQRITRQNEEYISELTVAMTANSFEDDKKEAYQAGMNDHIAKPYKQEEMIRTVIRHAADYHVSRN